MLTYFYFNFYSKVYRKAKLIHIFEILSYLVSFLTLIFYVTENYFSSDMLVAKCFNFYYKLILYFNIIEKNKTCILQTTVFFFFCKISHCPLALFLPLSSSFILSLLFFRLKLLKIGQLLPVQYSGQVRALKTDFPDLSLSSI